MPASCCGSQSPPVFSGVRKTVSKMYLLLCSLGTQSEDVRKKIEVKYLKEFFLFWGDS